MAGGPSIIAGAAGGLLATVAMSVVMVAGDKLGLMGDQPPTAISRTALARAGVDRPSAAAGLVAPVAHLGFGVAGGVGYALTRRAVAGVPGGLLGVLYGLAIWLISYKGWIPAMGILPPPEDDRPGRPAVMIAAHVVYGLLLGILIHPSEDRPAR